MTLPVLSAPAKAAMAADMAKAANLVPVRLMPTVAPASGESFMATIRRPSRLRRTATTVMARSENTTERNTALLAGSVRSMPGSCRGGTSMLPLTKTFDWLNTRVVTSTANAPVASAR